MSASFNRVILVGSLVRDPEYRRAVSNGMAVSDFRMVVDDPYKGRSAAREGRSNSLFIDVVTWDQLAESVHGYLRQGSRILVEGRLQQQEWTTRDGQRRSQIRVVASTVQFLDPMGPPSAGPSAPAAAPDGGAPAAPAPDGDTFSLK